MTKHDSAQSRTLRNPALDHLEVKALALSEAICKIDVLPAEDQRAALMNADEEANALSSNIVQLLRGETESTQFTQSPLIPDEARLKRFRVAIYDISKASNSMCSIAQLFPRCDAHEPGHVDPYMTIEAYTDVIEKNINLMLSMIENEEHLLTNEGGA
jgi:hypothetical protein